MRANFTQPAKGLIVWSACAIELQAGEHLETQPLKQYSERLLVQFEN